MEETLVKLKETWGGIVFLSDPYKEGSDVRLLKIGEEDFEQLEADQLAVQNMMASRYLATFEEEITGWQKSLTMVSDVLLSLTEIQRKWSYLEPLFIGSDEVRKELPAEATRFERIDEGVKIVLKDAGAAKLVNPACNKPGLYKELERLMAQLDQCEKALADFLDGKRRQFPRFYFVSKSDLLDILSNGSNPRRIMQHVTKVYLSTDSLLLEDRSGPGGRPTTWRFKSGVGVEEVDFSPPVLLEGKVEIYLQTVLDAQRSALQQALAKSINRLSTQDRGQWLMDRFPDKRASDPAQITLLVTGMEYVKMVDAALTRLETGQDRDALKKALEKSVEDLSALIRLTQSNLSKSDRTRIMCVPLMFSHP